jgi:cellulose synthase/poly-beta-1,6-N-acetylglucosamine synthase-like glycosyltransferase
MTTIYKGATKFSSRFINAINNQTYKNFDLLVINDNNKYLANLIKKKTNHHIKILNSSKSPIANRIHGLRYLKKSKYDLIFFLDFDDFPKKNYIESSLKFYKKKKLNLFSNKLTYKKKIFQKKNIITLSDLISDHQVGFGTLVVRRQFINEILKMNKFKVQFFDWFISLIYLINNRFLYINFNTQINYNESNLVSLKKPNLSKKNIIQNIKLIIKLYIGAISYLKKINKKKKSIHL